MFCLSVVHWHCSAPCLHNCPSFLPRGHTPSDPCTNWYTTRSPHSRICKSCDLHFVYSFLPTADVPSVDSDYVLFRSSMDRGSTRSVSRVQQVPLRFYWSIRTHLVPLLLFCQSLLQMMSFRASLHQRQHLPLTFPLLLSRSPQLSTSSVYVLFCLL